MGSNPTHCTMSILNQLLEKKDLMIYINLRIDKLSRDISKVPITIRYDKREFVIRQLKGRIKELKSIKNITTNKNIKQCSKELWKDLNEEPNI